MIIKLNDNTELEAIQVNGQRGFLQGGNRINSQICYFQGANRDSLEFHFAKTAVTFEQLDSLFAEQENTKRIIIQGPVLGEDGEYIFDGQGNYLLQDYLHENYTLRVSIGLIFWVVTPETPTDPAVIEERYSVVMAQKSYAELQQESLQETVDVMVLESLGLGV